MHVPDTSRVSGSSGVSATHRSDRTHPASAAFSGATDSAVADSVQVPASCVATEVLEDNASSIARSTVVGVPQSAEAKPVAVVV